MFVCQLRREFITLLGGTAAAWPLAARAQQPSRVPKLAIYRRFPQRPDSSHATKCFGRDYANSDMSMERISSLNIASRTRQFDRPAALAAELVQLKVDVIVAAVAQGSLEARDATKTIPILIAAVSDPVGSGLIENLARPGGNITGTSSQTSEVVGKSLELLKEVIPGIERTSRHFGIRQTSSSKRKC